MSQTGFSSHVVEVQDPPPPSLLPLSFLTHPGLSAVPPFMALPCFFQCLFASSKDWNGEVKVFNLFLVSSVCFGRQLTTHVTHREKERKEAEWMGQGDFSQGLKSHSVHRNPHNQVK